MKPDIHEVRLPPPIVDVPPLVWIESPCPVCEPAGEAPAAIEQPLPTSPPQGPWRAGVWAIIALLLVAGVLSVVWVRAYERALPPLALAPDPTPPCRVLVLPGYEGSSCAPCECVEAGYANSSAE
jgi:hypothetical protein